MTEEIKNNTEIDPVALKDTKTYYLRYYDEDGNLAEDIVPVTIGFEDTIAFLLVVGPQIMNEMHSKALMCALRKPLHPGPYRFIAKEHPWILVAIAIGVEANMMSIRTGTQPFEIVEFLKLHGVKEEVIIAPPLTGPSPERLQELSDRYKPLTGEDFPKGDVNTVITFVFEKVGIPITAQPDKPVTLNLRQISDTLARCLAGVSDKYLRARLPRSNYDTASELNPNEWSPSCAVRMADAALPSLGTMQIKHLYRDPIPPRDVAYPEVARDMCNLFTQSGNSTYPDWLKDMLLKDKGDGDASKQPGDDLLIDFSDGQTSAPNPTAGPTISSPPNPERPRAEAERPSSELNSLEETIPREYNATEAQTEPHESSASGMSSNQASDEFAALKEMVQSEFKVMFDRIAAFSETVHSEFKAMSDSNAALKEKIHSEFEAIHTSLAALRAELESFRTIERQRSAEAGPQTSARGEGDAPDALENSSQDSQQSVHCMALVLFEQGRNTGVQEAHDTGNIGSETSGATGNTNTSTTTRPTVSNSDEQTEDGEEAQAQTEIVPACNHNKLAGIIVFLVEILLLLGYVLSLDFKASQPITKTPTINCNAGTEVTSSFCREGKCVKVVNNEDVIIIKYM